MLDLLSSNSPAPYLFLTPLALQKRGRVLIADDQADFRLLCRRVLGLDGWDVLEAADGREVLRMVLDNPPDVMVLDQTMPYMKGEEVIHQLRTLDFDIPTVLVTSAEIVKPLADRLGIECYVGKPFRPEELKEAVAAARTRVHRRFF